jgi:hypothetical protein
VLKIKCTYFKEGGKYYTEGEDEFPSDLFEHHFNPRQYGRRLLELKRLPGIAGGTWDGPFVIEVHPSPGYPELCLFGASPENGRAQ